MLAKASAPSEAEAQLTKQKNNWSSWLSGHDYSKAPEGSILNYDLYSPAKQNQLESQYSNLNGVGGSALAQGGNATAIQMSRDHQAANRAERQAAGYENAVTAEDNYYKGNTLPLAQLEQSRVSNALGASSNREQFYTNAFVQTAPQPILPQLLGAAIGGASSILTGGMSGIFGGIAKGVGGVAAGQH